MFKSLIGDVIIIVNIKKNYINSNTETTKNRQIVKNWTPLLYA